MRTRLVVSLLVPVTVVLAACGGDDSSSSSDTVASTPAPAVSAATSAAAAAVSLNDADAEFAQGMIAHHEQALEMSEIALDPQVGAGPAVVDLATRIQAAQEPEIELMTAWLTAAGLPLEMDTSDGHDMSSMPGMMSAADMDALGKATGPEFDTMWLEMMIEHHRGAITQSEEVKAAGANPDVLALAQRIIDAQQGEIDEMTALLGQ